jgi:hypothetical protein
MTGAMNGHMDLKNDTVMNPPNESHSYIEFWFSQ